MVVRAPVLGSGAGLSAPAPARREFSGEARKPEAGRNCPSLSSQAVNASAASCTGNERPCGMRHRPLTTLESFLSSRCNAQRQGKKKSSISFTFTSRTTQCLADFLPRTAIVATSAPYPSNSTSLFNQSAFTTSCSQLGPRRNQQDDEHPQKQLWAAVECFHTSCNSSARVCDAPGPSIKSTTRENHTSRWDTLFFSTVPTFLSSSFFGIFFSFDGIVMERRD